MSETKITKMVVQKEGRKLIFNPAGDIDLSQYYTKSEIDTKFNSYALKTEIPDTSDLATKTELNSVKSTATTANNTANSAKTTAQNALNTANSKFAFTDTNDGVVSNITRFTRNSYGELQVSSSNGNRGSGYINGKNVVNASSYNDTTVYDSCTVIGTPGDTLSGSNFIFNGLYL